MTTTYKNITARLLILLMLLANNGINAHTLYCLCKGQYNISVTPISDDCELTRKPTTCCKKEATPCCQKEEKHNCSKRGIKYFKADLMGIAPSELTKNTIPAAIFEPVIIDYIDLVEVRLPSLLLVASPNKAPPIKPYGRQLLRLIQITRC